MVFVLVRYRASKGKHMSATDVNVKNAEVERAKEKLHEAFLENDPMKITSAIDKLITVKLQFNKVWDSEVTEARAKAEFEQILKYQRSLKWTAL